MSPLTAQPPASDAAAAQVEDTEETRHQHRSAIKAAFIGTFIEWFDYGPISICPRLSPGCSFRRWKVAAR